MIDVVIVGGGLAGAAAATRLAAAGRDVVILEREPGPHDKVCGEFLSHEAGMYIASLGVDLAALGAVPIEAVRLVHRDGAAAVALPFPALSLSRRALDEALLVRAAAAGATVLRGARVSELAATTTGWRARLADGPHVAARAAFLATGKHDLRGWKRPPGLQDDLIAFKLHLRLAPEQSALLARHVELALFDGGYAGLQPVEHGRANLCLLVRRRRFTAVGHTWEALLAAIRRECPHLELRLRGSEPCWARPLALSWIPYGSVRRAADGPFRLGDQAAVIPSFAGDGMSIALHSAELAASAHLAGHGADAFQRRLARDVTAQVLLATGLSHALVRPHAQFVLGRLARLFPGIMAAVAARTRVPDAALARARRDLAA